MKFLPLQKLDSINRALSFDTPDCRVLGGCELYTTKAAGGDKKLYKQISDNLAARLEAELQTFESSSSNGSPKTVSRGVYELLHSPFGRLDQVAARRTFAYIIATLNASHTDYDFSLVLRPQDFKRERKVKNVISSFNTTLFNLGVNLNKPLSAMWETIDCEMDLKSCEVYSYSPDDVSNDPYGDEGLIWSNIYFIFSKQKKRVCYLYLRGISALSHTPPAEMPMWGIGGPNQLFEEDSSDDEWLEDKSIWGDAYDEGWNDDDEMVERMEF